MRPGKGGSILQYALSARVYQSAVTRIDPAAREVEVEIEPPMMNADESFYDGTTVMDESCRRIWRHDVVRNVRWMYLGWPDTQRHAQRMTLADVPDADGNGKRMLHLLSPAFDVKDEDANKPLLDLDVTRVDPQAMRFYFRMPADREYQTGGWSYWNKQLVNEDGSRRWRAHYPGTLTAFRLRGDAPLTEASFPDADGDGRRLLYVYDFGPGDAARIPTEVTIRRLADGTAQLTSDTPARVSGEAWKMRK